MIVDVSKYFPKIIYLTSNDHDMTPWKDDHGIVFTIQHISVRGRARAISVMNIIRANRSGARHRRM